MIDIDITVDHGAWPDENLLLPLVESATQATINHLGFAQNASELSLLFTDDSHIRTINAEWRDKDKATNVLSFPAFALKAGDAPQRMLGDIILGYETVHQEAQDENKPFNHHLTHLIVHGLLHLLGYDHENDKDAEHMEALERDILQSLAIPDPYAVSL